MVIPPQNIGRGLSCPVAQPISPAQTGVRHTSTVERITVVCWSEANHAQKCRARHKPASTVQPRALPFGRSAVLGTTVGISRTATIAVRQNAMATGCISGTRRTRIAAVLTAATARLRTAATRGMGLEPVRGASQG